MRAAVEAEAAAVSHEVGAAAAAFRAARPRTAAYAIRIAGVVIIDRVAARAFRTGLDKVNLALIADSTVTTKVIWETAEVVSEIAPATRETTGATYKEKWVKAQISSVPPPGPEILAITAGTGATETPLIGRRAFPTSVTAPATVKVIGKARGKIDKAQGERHKAIGRPAGTIDRVIGKIKKTNGGIPPANVRKIAKNTEMKRAKIARIIAPICERTGKTSTKTFMTTMAGGEVTDTTTAAAAATGGDLAPAW